MASVNIDPTVLKRIIIAHGGWKGLYQGFEADCSSVHVTTSPMLAGGKHHSLDVDAMERRQEAERGNTHRIFSNS